MAVRLSGVEWSCRQVVQYEHAYDQTGLKIMKRSEIRKLGGHIFTLREVTQHNNWVEYRDVKAALVVYRCLFFSGTLVSSNISWLDTAFYVESVDGVEIISNYIMVARHERAIYICSISCNLFVSRWATWRLKLATAYRLAFILPILLEIFVKSYPLWYLSTLCTVLKFVVISAAFEYVVEGEILFVWYVFHILSCTSKLLCVKSTCEATACSGFL